MIPSLSNIPIGVPKTELAQRVAPRGGVKRGCTLDIQGLHLMGMPFEVLELILAACTVSELPSLAATSFEINAISDDRRRKMATLQRFIKPFVGFEKRPNFLCGGRVTIRFDGDDDMKTFSKALESGALASCKILDLRGNSIGDAGMEDFSTALATGALGQCTHLTLDHNLVGDAGMKAFSTALTNGALGQCTNLDLDHNLVGDAGMKAFSTALTNGALAQCKRLDMDHNTFGDAGMEAFANALISGKLAYCTLSGVLMRARGIARVLCHPRYWALA
jgi:hypothetical protein